MDQTALDLQDEMAQLWCSTFTLADYPRCKAIALEMIDYARRDGVDEPMFAFKSLAQSLHFLGEHAEARRIAEYVRREAKGYLACSTVHPYISMGIVLARIAFLDGRADEAKAIAADVLDRARTDNMVSICQVLAMASAPIAAWSGDEDRARAFAGSLRDEAESDQLNYWRVWGHNLLHAVDLHFHPDTAVDGAAEIDAMDPLQADHLATVDVRMMSQLALRRATSGIVGWSTPEVLRVQATTTAWYDPQEARRLLGEAGQMALRHGAVAWVERIEDTGRSLGPDYWPIVPPSRGGAGRPSL